MIKTAEPLHPAESPVAAEHRDDALPADLPAPLAEHMRAAGLGAGGLYLKLGIQITQATPDQVSGTMPVDGNTQPYGVLHGGASVAFAETLASIASVLHAGRHRLAVGVEVNATHHRAVNSGMVHGTAVAAHRGSSLATYDVRILDDNQRRICTCRVTCMIRPLPRLNGAAGQPVGAPKAPAVPSSAS